ncbi:MAG: HupE/UreJ family protein [Aestuariivirga sp.]
MKAVRVVAIFAALLLSLMHDAALAHKPSDSYLRIDAGGEKIEGQWDIALRDLDYAIGLDSNQDNAITWGEVKSKHARIAAYAMSRLTMSADGENCTPGIRDHMIDNHSDGAYAVLVFTADCPKRSILNVDYRLFFDIDPQHRGLLSLTTATGTRSAIFSANEAAKQFALDEVSRSQQFIDYVREGMVHIWAGFDHILFLLALLLPAVLIRSPKRGEAWVPASSFGSAMWSVAKVVTAFTVAHSITLSLAALGAVSLPSRLVESAIAASVVLAALNNIRPVAHDGRWIIAFVFGLIHGFGFASVLADLGLPRESLVLSLVAFNVGVELGQLAIVAVFLPAAYAVCTTQFYRRIVLVGGSAAVAAVAAIWLIQRALLVTLVPALGG